MWGLHTRQRHDDFIVEYRNWEPMKDLESYDQSYILERLLRAVEKLDKAHF